MMKKCYKCQEIKDINDFQLRKTSKDGHQNMCRACMSEYNKQQRKKTNYKRPNDICYICNTFGPVYSRIDGKPVCQKHYRENYNPPEEYCYICGKLAKVTKRTDDGPICENCYDKTYHAPEEICFNCGQLKKVKRRIDYQPLCRRCYKNFLYNTDEKFRLKEILKSELRYAFKTYSFNGKKLHAKEYDIDYSAIIEHLGPCPGNREDYNIDHILPLSAFNFDDPIQVRAAFAPENHQWLPVKENLHKSNKYDKKVLSKYLEKFIKET